MSERNTVLRSLHDLGLAAWFGGTLMGAVGLNGASTDVADPMDRSRVAAAGWSRWSPLNAVAIGAYAIGGAGLLRANRLRLAHQSGVRSSSVVKTALTGAALGVTAYSGWLGGRLAREGQVPSGGGTTPVESTPDDVASTQQQLRGAQWAVPALTGAIIVVSSLQGEQQRPAQVAAGVTRAALHRVGDAATTRAADTRDRSAKAGKKARKKAAKAGSRAGDRAATSTRQAGRSAGSTVRRAVR